MKTAVILTVYKRYNYYNEALNSVLHQTTPPDQIVIITDNMRIVENYQNIRNLTVIEADYPKYGKKIAEATNVLHNDIDIVLFLEDDDLFDKYKIEYVKKIFEQNDLVMIHNLQKYIDINGEEVYDAHAKEYEKNQPREETLITSDNIHLLYKRYPSLHHNISSMTIRRDILDKYKSFINELEILLDIPLLFISVLEGKVLHVPNRLTYFRLGSGISSYRRITSYNEFVENEWRITCLSNKMLNDLRKLYIILNSCKNCKKVIDVEILRKETTLYLLNNYFNCDYKANISSYRSLLYRCIKYFVNNQISLLEFIIHLGKISLPLIYGKKKSSELFLEEKYKRYIKNKFSSKS